MNNPSPSGDPPLLHQISTHWTLLNDRGHFVYRYAPALKAYLEALLRSPANAEEVLQALHLPYRVVAVCGGDLGLPQVKKYDIETWMPSRQAYGETHSASKFHDFQARRLRLRYRDQDGNVRFVHTLNNTVIASPRILIPLLELNQRADGSVAIPAVLQPYMGGLQAIVPR